MAKARAKDVNKTEEIRKELAKTDSPKQVAENLTARGIKVTPQYVSTIKANDKKRANKPPGKVGRPMKNALANGFSVDAIVEMQKIIESVGVDVARDCFTIAERIVERGRQ